MDKVCRYPWFVVCSCKRYPKAAPDGVRHPIDDSDSWVVFERFSEAQAELDRLLELDDTYTAVLSVVLAGDGGPYDEPYRPIKYTGSFWRSLKHQMSLPKKGTLPCQKVGGSA